jgi:hypothetical protein
MAELIEPGKIKLSQAEEALIILGESRGRRAERKRIIDLLTAASDGSEVSISLSSLTALIYGEN